MALLKFDFIYLSIPLLLVVIQLISQVCCSSNEENEVDSSNTFVPLALRNILTNEVESYDIPREIQENLIYYLSGFDDSSRPVWVVEAGKWDIRSFVEQGAQKDLERFFLQGVYRMLNSTQILSSEEDPVTEMVVLVDLENFPLKQITSVPTTAFVLKQYQKFLPVFEKLNAAYLVNSNYAAETGIKLLRPILGSAFDKLIVYGSNKSKWIPQILKNIPRDQLPDWYGGTKDFTPYKVYG